MHCTIKARDQTPSRQFPQFIGSIAGHANLRSKLSARVRSIVGEAFEALVADVQSLVREWPGAKASVRLLASTAVRCELC